MDNNNAGINLVKPTKFFLFSEQVHVHLPLPRCNVANWYEDFNYTENTGIVYKGVNVSVEQLLHIIKWSERSTEDKRISPLIDDVSIKFDGMTVTRKDLNDMKHICWFVKNVKERRFNGQKLFKRGEPTKPGSWGEIIFTVI